MFDWGALYDWIWLLAVLPLFATLTRGAFDNWTRRSLLRLGWIVVTLGSLGLAAHLFLIWIDPWPYVINVAELTMGTWFSIPSLLLASAIYLSYLAWGADATRKHWRRIFRT